MENVSYNDINISKSFFKAPLAPGALLVSSIFGPTIQGEGPFAGNPAVFMRLAGCNRGNKLSSAGCSWCDADFRVERSTWMTVERISAEYDRIAKPLKEYPIVVITGGEPLLQNIKPLCNYLRERHSDEFVIQIESNGDYPPKDLHDWPDCMHWVISPKIGNGHSKYPKLKSIWHDAACNLSSVYLKTLVSADPDSPYHNVHPAMEDFNFHGFFSPIAVYKRPLNPGEIVSFWDHDLVDVEKTRANHEYAARLAIKYGARLSLQTHQLIGMP